MSKETGGWAFPRPMSKDEGDVVIGQGNYYSDQRGMTLRDYIASQVISGQLRSGDTMEVIANRAYAIADAMIKEREK